MRLAGRSLPLERLSASSMGLFVQCPEQWRLKYLKDYKESQFGARFMGSVNHQTVASVLSVRRLGGLLTERMSDDERREYVRILYRETWEELLKEEGEPDWRDDDPVEMFARGLQMALAYVNEIVPKITPIAVEERVEMTIPGLPKLIGYVDVIEPTKIRERKTTHQKMTKPKPAWRFQARIYQLITGLPVEWDVITRQVETKLYTAEEWPDLRFELADIKETERMIRHILSRMEDLYVRYGPDEHWPMDGYFGDWTCDYCFAGPKYGGWCPAHEGESKLEIPREKNGHFAETKAGF